MDPSRAGAAVAAHPLVERVTPVLTGDVSAVGGVVRDALAGLGHGPDLDLVVEGDAVAEAARIGRALGARVVAHPRFGTAHIELPHGGHVDLVSARTETYAAPGALPTVGPGSLLDDLARRDFTVNAMALGLCGTRAGELIDPHDGAADLAAGLLRAVRADTFVEDPSRLVRAARYAARLDLALAPGTEAAARAVAPVLGLGSARIAEELRRVLDEDGATGALALLRDLGVPWVREGARVAIAALEAAAAHPGAPAVPVWALRLGGGVEADAVAGAALPGWARAIAAEAAAGAGLAERLSQAAAPSEIDRMLRAVPPATAIGALAAGAPAVAGWWASDRAPSVTGADLVRAGVAPGPAIGRALAEVRAALLDGRVDDHDAQLALALRAAREAT
ncbi:MAG: CCA tRNA nucleotidyltransferase [Thermoleophilia bacterium]|nr:CCA tRNA nucleotidyltransferase [Thermoleophilia bacterium]